MRSDHQLEGGAENRFSSMMTGARTITLVKNGDLDAFLARCAPVSWKRGRAMST
ncbi:hypothetical protein HMPREF3223_01880 [Cutibacterium avidum]|uniref:Uncharacterized protein n=1 Tax=Cutibacterium avidum ATCC 25577 TaxID=997355 RepID=G4D063_9ACTN|nr:hypothetical protein HMPREF9153_2085 [Cutibacterium avidum ATCC 25577]KXA66728.1 hypothetical protein HMPREF3223_01880 [Cutibacterium avidum]